MAHLLPALFAGLVGSWAAAASWLLREARRVLRHVPPAVADLLRHEPLRTELLRIVTQVAAYANLSKEERRLKAIEFVGTWLENHGVRLSESELNLLVELVYNWVRRQSPEKIAPAPLALGSSSPANGGRS